MGGALPALNAVVERAKKLLALCGGWYASPLERKRGLLMPPTVVYRSGKVR